MCGTAAWQLKYAVVKKQNEGLTDKANKLEENNRRAPFNRNIDNCNC